VLPTVPVPRISLADYAEDAGEDAVERLIEAARPLKGLRMLQINSTAFGGGVSELLQTQIGLLQDLGIDVTWQLLQGTEEFFAVTKAVHNGMQGASVEWTSQMRETYLERVRANASELEDGYDCYWIHDPQPAAMLPILEEQDRRSGKWVWRCHIDTSSPMRDVWDFFVPFVNRYDAAVFTMSDYVGPGINGPVLAFITPTIDPLSMKNVYVDPDTSSAVLRHYGIDRQRPIVLQVSRFDPWKDPLGVIDAYRSIKPDFPETQLVLVGSMAHDDPEGWEFLRMTQDHAQGDPDVHLLTNLEQVGNLEVNSFQRTATVVLQKSIREGFGLTVSEAMWKRKPVIGGRVGGITLQIEEGVTGHLVDSPDECATRIAELLADPQARHQMGDAGHDRVRERFLTLRELEDYLGLISRL
jgi:trehalose synthase